jgi:uncharacterized phage protein (predicted DNA packaging)
MYVTLEDIKRHLNVDFNDDDNLITSMIEAAEASIEKSIGAPLAELAPDGTLPKDLIHAIRMMTSVFYEYREGFTYGKIAQVPYTLSNLLAPYIKLT